MNHRNLMFAATITFAVLGVIAVTAEVSAEETAGGIAVVNLAELQANFGELRAREEDLGHWLEERRSRYNELSNYVFLSRTDFEEAVEILERARPLSEEDRERLQELRAVSDQREERFSELRAKPDRTPEEAAEFNTLQETYDARVEALQGMQQEIVQELERRRGTALTGLMERVEEAIVEAAEALGYDIVLDADAVFLGGDDITEAVLERLNYGTDGPPTTEEPAEGEADQEDDGGAQDDDNEGDG